MTIQFLFNKAMPLEVHTSRSGMSVEDLSLKCSNMSKNSPNCSRLDSLLSLISVINLGLQPYFLILKIQIFHTYCISFWRLHNIHGGVDTKCRHPLLLVGGRVTKGVDTHVDTSGRVRSEPIGRGYKPLSNPLNPPRFKP